MSDDDIRVLLQALEERLEQRMVRASSASAPPNGLRGWKAAGLVLSVLTAVTAPVLGVTWYASTRMNQIDDVQKELDNARGDVSLLRSSVAADLAELRRDVQRLREAFAAYTQTLLPMIARDPSDDMTFRPRRSPYAPVGPVQAAGSEGGGEP